MDALLDILGRPDNIAVVALIPGAIVLVALWWRAARHNDRLLAEGGEQRVAEHMAGGLAAVDEQVGAACGEPDSAARPAARVHTWPNLVRVELMVALAVVLILTVWAIVVDAPLEQMADPARTPNPSKAPWYFLGLQEMLVYFDPWIAGVVLPLLIIFGLCAVPYLDVNPAGEGYYCWRGRRFAITTFLFGFLVLWLLLILIGVFCRGPGWGWFWPWEPWDRARGAAVDTVTWARLFGIRSEIGASVFGGATVTLYYATAGVYWALRRKTSEALLRLGPTRYAITAFLFLTMMALPIKMALHLGLSVKYVWTTPWFKI